MRKKNVVYTKTEETVCILLFYIEILIIKIDTYCEGPNRLSEKDTLRPGKPLSDLPPTLSAGLVKFVSSSLESSSEC